MILPRILIIVALLFSLISCSDKKEEYQTEPSSSALTETDSARLNQFINLPVEPLWIKWEINKVTLPADKLDTGDWSIIARMELSEKDVKFLATVPLPNKVTKLPAYTIEPWVQDIIDTKFKPDETGDYYIPQGTMLSAEQFYRDPLITGAVYMISDTEILLFLQTDPEK